MTDAINPLSFRSRTARVAVLGLVVIDLLAVAGAWRLLAGERRDRLDDAARSTRNLAHALGENLEGTILTVDLALGDALGDVTEQLAQGAVQHERFEQHVARLNAQIGFTEGIRVADVQGRVVHGTGLPRGKLVDVSDRDYFAAAKGAVPGRLVVSSPIVSRISGNLVVVFARRITLRDGSFGGIVYAVVPVERLARSLERVSLGEDGAVVLRGRDNAVVARFPERAQGEKVVGQRKISPELAAVLSSGVAETTFLSTSPVDGREKVTAYRKLLGGEFFLLVSTSKDTILAGWRGEALRTAAAVAVFVALTSLVGLFALRGWRRETEARFRALVEGAPIAVTVARGGRVLYVNQAFARTLGLPGPEAAIGRSILDSMGADDAARTAERWERLQRGLPVEPVAELTLRRPDGKTLRAAVTDAMVDLHDGPATIGFVQDVTERQRFDEERERLIGELKAALADVKTLSGLLPICAHCKKVRDDRGYWSRIETYIRERSHAEFTHGICPDCAREYFPEEDPDAKDRPA